VCHIEKVLPLVEILSQVNFLNFDDQSETQAEKLCFKFIFICIAKFAFFFDYLKNEKKVSEFFLYSKDHLV